MPKFPDVNVELIGHDGNAYSVLGRVARALEAGGASREDIDLFYDDATSGDYDHLLSTCREYVNVC